MRNPVAYAALAALYIASVVSALRAVALLAGPHDTPLIPMAMLSLFVLSAAVMGFLFVSEPLLLCFEGKRKEAVRFFLATVGCFACFGAAFAGAAISLSFS